MQAQLIQVETGSDYKVPLQCFHAADRRAPAILVLPALGVGARFYRPLAQALAERGLSTVLFDQRGHCDSSVRASRRCNWGFAQWLQVDIPAARDWAGNALDAAEVVLMGHSLGGHLATCYAGLHPAATPRLILAACGTPWHLAFRGAMRWQIRLATLLIPLFSLVPGYFPGHLLGFGGREARQLMMDWRQLAVRNRYSAAGMAGNLDQCIGLWSGQALSLGYAADRLAPEAAIAAMTAKLRQAVVTRRALDSAQIGGTADHFGWVRRPAATAALIQSWLNTSNRAGQ